MTLEKPWPVAAVSGVALLALAFWVATVFESSGMLSTVPPATEANPNPQVDTDETTILALYQSAFTAWAALILLIPAYAYYLAQGANWAWLAFWTVSYLAYIVHLYVSAFLFFGGDFTWMTSSSRVSAFWPGMLLIPWWGLDIALAFKGVTATWVRIQRGVLHLGTFVLFFGGSAIKGETMTIKALGLALALVALMALIKGVRPRRIQEAT